MVATSLFGDCGPVRIAVETDEEELVGMLRHHAEECGIRYSSGRSLSFSPFRARMTIRHALTPMKDMTVDGPGGVIGIIGPPGALEAAIGIGVQYPWFSDEPYLTEIWNHVRPEYRRGPHSRALIGFAKHVADVTQMPLMMGVVCTERQAAKARLYEREVGVEPFGAYFLYNRGDQKVARNGA
jgi:hypothetical protein